MEGAADRQRKEYDLATAQAWHTAMFALNGYGGKLKGKTLADYLSDPAVKRTRSRWADAHAFFGRLKAKGVPIETTH
jgi:hypothetical protein